jgi:hypothetical protein
MQHPLLPKATPIPVLQQITLQQLKVQHLQLKKIAVNPVKLAVLPAMKNSNVIFNDVAAFLTYQLKIHRYINASFFNLIKKNKIC